jgi:hypothetical protein
VKIGRRQFLAATAGSVLLRAQQDPAPNSPCQPNADCTLPGFPIPPFPVAEAKLPEWPAGGAKVRPLWSHWSKYHSKDTARIARSLRTAWERMAQYPCSDPRSLYYQAALHRYYCGPEIAEPPIPGPVHSVHQNWAFLPWHRAFIYFHERLIQRLSGDPDFRLPVWDWEAFDGDSPLAPIFDGLGPTAPAACPAAKVLPRINPCLTQAWLQCGYEAFVTGEKGQPPMAKEGPHSTIHVLSGGFMRPTETAAAVPHFYSHHANVDRFWEHWRAAHDGVWLPGIDQGTKMYFYDFPMQGDPRPVVITPGDLQDVRRLGYRYEKSRMALASLNRAVAQAAADGTLAFEADALKHLAEAIPKMLLNLSRTVPVRIAFRLPDTQPGKYYVVGVRTNEKDPVLVLGGFGVFGTHHGNDRFTAACCLTTRDLDRAWQLIRNFEKLQLLCGPLDDKLSSDNPSAELRMTPEGMQIIEPVFFEIQFPK